MKLKMPNSVFVKKKIRLSVYKMGGIMCAERFFLKRQNVILQHHRSSIKYLTSLTLLHCRQFRQYCMLYKLFTEIGTIRSDSVDLNNIPYVIYTVATTD